MSLNKVVLRDICKKQEIIARLEGLGKDYKVIVLNDGRIYYVEPVSLAGKRRMQKFFNGVKPILGVIQITTVTVIEFGQWENANVNRLNKQSDQRTTTAIAINESVDWIFQTAIRKKASDVYLFIGRDETRFEIKIYGIKSVEAKFNTEVGLRLANLIFTAAKGQFDRTQPCDCSFSQDCDGKTYRIRGNSLPTSNGGNTLACRIRDPKEIKNIDSLGYLPEQLRDLETICSAPGGLVLFTGATNSGKSTSVTSLMSDVPTTSHMIEMADPVEIELPNCTHVELDRYHKDHDSRFNLVLAAFVRQNPDVLALGEIRDERTAKAAVNMAIQGKRVFTTLHSTSAAGVFTRLEGLGVEDYVLALPEFIAGVISQNLVPVSCDKCGLNFNQIRPYLSEKVATYLASLDTTNMVFSNKNGCEECICGVTGQTLVAEVHPFVGDSGGLYEIITSKKYYEILNYMVKAHSILTKVEVANIKMIRGEIDPLATMRIVGGFRVEAAPAVRELKVV